MDIVQKISKFLIKPDAMANYYAIVATSQRTGKERLVASVKVPISLVAQIVASSVAIPFHILTATFLCLGKFAKGEFKAGIKKFTPALEHGRAIIIFPMYTVCFIGKMLWNAPKNIYNWNTIVDAHRFHRVPHDEGFEENPAL